VGRDQYNINSVNVTLCRHENLRAATHPANETPVSELYFSYYHRTDIQSQNDTGARSEFNGFSSLFDYGIKLIASVRDFVAMTYAAVMARIEGWY
jgi:hypothetical protein